MKWVRKHTKQDINPAPFDKMKTVNLQQLRTYIHQTEQKVRGKHTNVKILMILARIGQGGLK